MSAARYVILNHVDSPLRFLLWTPGEIMLYLGPFFLGVALDQLLLGAITTVCNIWANRQYKRKFGKGQFHAVRYWFYPTKPNVYLAFRHLISVSIWDEV